MACTIRFFNSRPDGLPNAPSADSIQSGDPVGVYAPGHTPGALVVPPYFFFVHISNALRSEAQAYINGWYVDLDYEIVAQDLVTDTFSLRLTNGLEAQSDIPYVVNRGRINPARMQKFMDGWNAKNYIEISNGIECDVQIEDALRSRMFWDLPGGYRQHLTLNQLSYDQGTGVHQCEVLYDHTEPTIQSTDLEVHIERKATVVSHEMDRLVFEARRNDVWVALKAEVKDRMRTQVRKRRFRLPPNVVSNILAQGGEITVTKAQFINYVEDLVTKV